MTHKKNLYIKNLGARIDTIFIFCPVLLISRYQIELESSFLNHLRKHFKELKPPLKSADCFVKKSKLSESFRFTVFLLQIRLKSISK